MRANVKARVPGDAFRVLRDEDSVIAGAVAANAHGQ
jgi:hypothetical protein